MTRTFIFAVAIAALSLSGCAMQHQATPNEPRAVAEMAPPPPPPLPPPPAPNSAAPLPPQIVRYIGANQSGWPIGQANGAAPATLSDLYARVELYSDAGNVGATSSVAGDVHPNLRNYAAENRGWVARLWAAETDTVTTLANIEVKDPELKLAIPLFSVSHASGRDLGNTWVTNFTASNVESPLFRIGPNTGLTVHVNVKASSDLKSQGTAMVVGAVTQAVSIAAPTATLLTTLSKPEVNSAAQAIDTALSGLFSHDITEDIELGRFADTWTPQASLKLTGCAPMIATDSTAGQEADVPPATSNGCSGKPDMNGDYDMAVGTWTLDLRCPRVSAFDPRDICHDFPGGPAVSPASGMIDLTSANLTAMYKTIAASAGDAQILQFALSSQVTIQAHVLAQSWYSAFSKSGQGKKPGADDYTSLCANALTDLYASGLSRFDAALALRAMIEQLPDLVTHAGDFTGTNGTGCRNLLSAVSVMLASNVTGSPTTNKSAKK